MGRKLMRVPLDFNAPLNEIWKGYTLKNAPEGTVFPVKSCDECEEKYDECSESASYCVFHNPELRKLWYQEPPKGEGYQLWETTTEGSPKSPVFERLEELSAWCEINATTFASYKATKEKWFEMLSNDSVHHTSGCVMFI